MNVKKNQFKRIFVYIKPYLIFAVFSILCSLISAVSQLIVPILCGKAIDSMITSGADAFAGVLRCIAAIIVVTAVSAPAQQLAAMCNNKITFCISRDLRNEITEKLHRLPMPYLDNHPSGDLLSRVITDVDTFADGMLMGFTQLFTGIVTIIGTLLIMLSYNITISVIVILLTPLSLFTASFISKRTHKYFAEQARIKGEETALINEIIDGQKVISSYSCEAEMMEKFNEVNNRLQKSSFNATFFSSLTNPTTRLVNNIVYAGVSLVSALYAVGGGITVGQLSVFLSYAGQYAKPFNEISGVITELQNASASINRVFELLDETDEVSDKPNAVTLKNGNEVAFKHIYFSYVPERPLIKNISLDVKNGQKIAIVGPTGCGKTTLINLLMRFYDVNSGEICINGVDIRDYTRKSLRGNFGMVLQDTWLKSGTIRDNIAYGKTDALQEEIEAAAKAAHAHSFIKRLPNGYDTLISESGGNISAGQKQLLCIARVMLLMPPMLILDEATSSIDTRTELKIQSAFDRMMQGRTSFVVAHRLSTIKGADIILVMKDGNIIERGNHDELLKLGGFYAKLYESRFAVD